jgi:hypothetical protein
MAVKSLAKSDKENQPDLVNQAPNLKRKKTEVELKEDLSKFRQNKLNSTSGPVAPSAELTTKRRALGSSNRPDLNQTVSGSLAVDSKKKLLTTTSKSNASTAASSRTSSLTRTKRYVHFYSFITTN